MESFSDANDKSITIDKKYSLFVEHLKENVEKHFELDKNNNSKRKECLTDEIIQIIDQKSLAFVDWQNHRGTKLETKYRNKYNRLRKLVKIKSDARQKE